MKQTKEKNSDITQEQKMAIAITIRNDLNFEKNPNIFLPAQGRGEIKDRIIKWETKSEDGSVATSQIKIYPLADYGNLNTEDQKVLYALIKLWDEKDRPEILYFSLSELAKKLKKSWSSRTHKSLKQSLLRLSVTSFVWFNSYREGVTKKYFKELRAFTILTDLHIAEAGEEQSHPNKQSCRIRFNLYLDSNLRSKHTQPIFYNQIIRFKSGIAQLIYQHLELVMHDKTRYERTSYNLFFEDLQLECVDYKYPSGRKKALDIAVKELQGVVIPSGIVNVSVEFTKDKQDYKIVVIKEEQTLLTLKCEEEPNQQTNNQEAVPEKTAQESNQPKQTLAEQIVLCFLEKFHLPRKKALRNEILTAKEWIEEYKFDLEKGQIFINYSKKWALETSFEPQNFAGLGQYLDRALDKIKEMEIVKQRENCKLCDFDGKVNCKEASDRYFLWNCPHNLEQIQNHADTYKVKIQLNSGTVLVPS